MGKHTKGPWNICEPSAHKNTFWVDAEGGNVALFDVKAIDVGMKGAYANAVLISAAPELLEALEELEHFVTQLEFSQDDDGKIYPVVSIARKVIKKAKGEET